MSSRRSTGSWILLGLVLAATALVRLRLLDVPLDRDEGEYAYLGQLLLQGVPPYATAYNLKLPGIYGAYAVVLWTFGLSPAGVHLGLLVVNAAGTLLVFALGTRMFDRATGLAAAIVFAGLSLSPRMNGLAGYAEHFVLVPALAGALVLFSAAESRRAGPLFASGLLFGLAFVLKQSGGAFVLFALAYTLVRTVPSFPTGLVRGVVPALALLAGATIPYTVVCALLAATGVFERFWFWTVTYAFRYASAVPIRAAITIFWQQAAFILATSYVPVVLAVAGVLVLFRTTDPRRRAFVMVFAGASVAATAAGLHFRNQYFLLLVPAVAILAGLAIARLAGLGAGRTFAFPRVLVALIAALAVAHLFWSERAILLEASPLQVARAVYGLNPFPESIEIARWVRARSQPTDRLAVIGSEPEIYFYAGRPAATGYIYTYAMMEDQPYASRMQRQMIEEIEAADPRFVILVNVSSSWLVQPRSDFTLFRWWEQYQHRFARVGIVDIRNPETTYVWDAPAATYVPKSQVWITVLERKAP